MDKLKEHLLRSRDELDVDSPASETWENIEAGMAGSGRGPVFSSRVIRRYAAAACVIALAGVGAWWVMREKKAPVEVVKQEVRTGRDSAKAGKVEPREAPPARDVAVNPTPTRDVAVNPASSPAKRVRRIVRSKKPAGPTDQIDAIDKSYSTLIDYQLKKLRATPLYAENGNYFSFYVDQLKQMDEDEQQVRNEIKAYGLTSEYLEQLINVYQQKLNLLKNLQTEINKVNNKVRENTAPSTKTEVYYLNI